MYGRNGRFQARAPLGYSTNTLYYSFEQHDNGHSVYEDREAGIGHWVIIEAQCPAEANAKAEQLGLLFDDTDETWMRYQIKNNRYHRQPTEFNRGRKYPQAHLPTIVRIDEPWVGARTRKNGKWSDGPEGYIHFWDGRIEPFYR